MNLPRLLLGGLLLTACVLGQTPRPPPPPPVDESVLFIPPGFAQMGQPRWATAETSGHLRMYCVSVNVPFGRDG